MADGRLLAGIRRFWTKEQVETAYQAVLSAYGDGISKEVVIIGADFDGQHSNGQWVLDRAAMVGWLDVLEARMLEIEDDAAGLPALAYPPSTDFSSRPMGT